MFIFKEKQRDSQKQTTNGKTGTKIYMPLSISHLKGISRLFYTKTDTETGLEDFGSS